MKHILNSNGSWIDEIKKVVWCLNRSWTHQLFQPTLAYGVTDQQVKCPGGCPDTLPSIPCSSKYPPSPQIPILPTLFLCPFLSISLHLSDHSPAPFPTSSPIQHHYPPHSCHSPSPPSTPPFLLPIPHDCYGGWWKGSC